MLKDHQDGKILLKTDKISKRKPITIAPQERRDAHKQLNLS
ncbi:hypothetical protein [[Erwinia] mediterraneensis]|nr:hypothetical protein [[Erwinia] mediterraneensis]